MLTESASPFKYYILDRCLWRFALFISFLMPKIPEGKNEKGRLNSHPFNVNPQTHNMG